MITIDKIPSEAMYIITTLKEKGYEAYLVGGCVRDLCLGRTPKDFDMTTSATPQQVRDSFDRVIPTGTPHGTVTVLVNKLPFEVTTFRTGVGSDPSEFGTSVEEDINHRDLTINGLLFDGEKVIDLSGGLSDLQEGIIRTIGDPTERFEEDYLRMMRAIRFSCQLGFTLDPMTLEAISTHCFGITTVSAERIRDELEKILLSKNPEAGLTLLKCTGLARNILPNVFYSSNFDHILEVIARVPATRILRLSAFLHATDRPVPFRYKIDPVFGTSTMNICADTAGVILRKLKYDNKTIATVKTLVREYMGFHPTFREGSIKELLARVGKDTINDLFHLQHAYIVSSRPIYSVSDFIYFKGEIQRIIEANEPITIKDLAVDGRDLIKLGVEPGSNLGKVLDNLLSTVLEKPDLNTREGLLGLLKLNQ